MCTYLTEKVDLEGSGKGPEGWFRLRCATVYLDHPQHAPAEHTLNIDFLNPDRGPSARVAVELDPASAEALARAILRTLEEAPAGLVTESMRAAAGMRGQGRRLRSAEAAASQ
jgi:hypothetical protein